MSKSDTMWLLVFAAMMLGTAAGLYAVRTRVLSNYSPERAAAQWQEWRDTTESMALEPQSTSRSVVATDVPPAYTLLKDHFLACLFGMLVTSGVFFGVILWMLRGVLKPGPINGSVHESSVSTTVGGAAVAAQRDA